MRKLSCHSGLAVLLLTVVRAHNIELTQISHHTSYSAPPSDIPGAQLPLESLPFEEMEGSAARGRGGFVSGDLGSARRFVWPKSRADIQWTST